jgi:hypothetical protein
MKIKPITIVCGSAAEANALAEEYAYIGRVTWRDGRFLKILTR